MVQGLCNTVIVIFHTSLHVVVDISDLVLELSHVQRVPMVLGTWQWLQGWRERSLEGGESKPTLAVQVRVWRRCIASPLPRLFSCLKQKGRRGRCVVLRWMGGGYDIRLWDCRSGHFCSTPFYYYRNRTSQIKLDIILAGKTFMDQQFGCPGPLTV